MSTTYATKEEAIAAARKEPRPRCFLLKVHGGRYAQAPEAWGYDKTASSFGERGKKKLPRIIGFVQKATWVDLSDFETVAR